MAINRFSQSSVQNAFPKYNSLWDGVSAAGGMDTIGSTVIVSATNTVTFSSIPSTYSHLQLRFYAQTNRATYIIDDSFLAFNSDVTGANYYSHNVYGQGSNAYSSPYAGNAGGGQGIFWPYTFGSTAGGTVTTVWSSGIMDILDYASTTKNKTVRCLCGSNASGSTAGGYASAVLLNSGVWANNTTAISTLTFKANGNFAVGSSFALYGIK
jgi:hypothetical protein